jgi:hypothetical protein
METILVVVGSVLILLASTQDKNGRPLNSLSKWFGFNVAIAGSLNSGTPAGFFLYAFLGLIIFFLADYDSYLKGTQRTHFWRMFRHPSE